MHLVYFDESKHDKNISPYFFLGGLIVSQAHAPQLEKSLMQIQYNFFGTNILTKDTELHGAEIFAGKGNFKGRSLQDRLALFDSILMCLSKNSVAARFVRFDVPAHRAKYAYPEPEYRLSLMLFMEKVCDYLDQMDDLGIMNGDFEKDEISKSVLDFSQFKANNKTPMYYGRALGRLIDTIYFTHSHYSRFLQAADIVCYLCQRYESKRVHSTHHDKVLAENWFQFKNKINFIIKDWP